MTNGGEHKNVQIRIQMEGGVKVLTSGGRKGIARRVKRSGEEEERRGCKIICVFGQELTTVSTGVQTATAGG